MNTASNISREQGLYMGGLEMREGEEQSDVTIL